MNTIFFTLTWQIEELKAHPMPLFTLMLAFEATTLWVIYLSFNLCTFNLPWFFAATFFYDTSCESVQRVMEIFNNFSFVQIDVGLLTSPFIQMCISVDLIWTIRQPFTPKEPRVKLFYALTFILVLSQFLVPDFLSKYNLIETKMNYLGYIRLFVIFFTCLISVISITYGSFKLCKPNISQKMSRLILARHIVTITFLMLVNMYIILGVAYYTITKTDPKTVDLNSTTILILQVIFGGQGLLLPLTRVFEPYFYTITLRKVRNFLEAIASRGPSS